MKVFLMTKREAQVVLEAKQKEFERLSDYALNQMSLIEVGLNPSSQSRNQDDHDRRWAPLDRDIQKLAETLRACKIVYVLIMDLEYEKAKGDKDT